MPVLLRWLLRLGPLNPVAVRLVQGGSRRQRHLYIRAGYLGILIASLLYALLISNGVGGGMVSYRGLAEAGAAAFTFVAYLQIALICLLAPVFMAGAIAQEANPRTWDILLTTPMSAAEIVLGNLFGRLFFILALLFSSLPLFALTQYFGGVPGSSIFASYGIAASAALLVGASAIALSVSRLVGKRAVFAFYVSVVSYLALTFAIDRLEQSYAPGVTWMTALNPFLALFALLDPTGYPALQGPQTTMETFFLAHPVRAWCTLSMGVSLALMVMSSITVRAGGIAGLGGLMGREGGGGAPWYRSIFGLGASGAEHRPPRHVWQNPIAWREAAARNATFGRMLARWTFIGAGALFGIGLILYYHGGALSSPTFRTIVMTASLGQLGVITLVALNMAATSVAREREDGTLDLLLTTPLTPSAYLSGKLRGMIAYLLPLLAVPLGTLALAGLYVGAVDGGLFTRGAGGVGSAGASVTLPFTIPSSLTGAAPVTFQLPAVLPESVIVAPLVTIPFIAVCVVVGMMWSLKSKGSIASVVSTVAVVGIFSGILGLCGWKAGADLAVAGPVAAALSPATTIFALVHPDAAMTATLNLNGAGLLAARVGLFLGAIIAAGVQAGFVYGVHANMVRTFDMTVRKLAGTA